MRRIITVIALLSMITSAQAENKTAKEFSKTANQNSETPIYRTDVAKTDWRSGKWRRNVPEHLLTVGIGGTYTINAGAKTTNPFGVGATVAYQYKMRNWKINSHFTTSFGGYTGILYYRGASVVRTAEGARHDVIFDRYKSHAVVPLMLSANLHYDFNKTTIFLGVDAGANMIIGERDYEKDGVIYVQKNVDELRITRFLPSARGKIGFMQEFSPSIKLKFQAGVQYEMGHKDDFNGAFANGGYDKDVVATDLERAAAIDPFAEIGLVISL